MDSQRTGLYVCIDTKDGRRWKTTQCTLNEKKPLRLSAGDYQIYAQKDKWKSDKATVCILQGQTNQVVLELKPPARRLSDQERLDQIEKLGHVPEDAEMPRDWNLAQQTTWWGKPMDAKTFWNTGIPQEAKPERDPSLFRRNATDLGGAALRFFSSFCRAV